MSKPQKLYIVRKYVMASCAQDAIKREKLYKVDDVWVDEEWKRQQKEQLPGAIGFTHEDNEE